MSLIAYDNATLLIPDETDAKNVVTKFRVLWLSNCKVESTRDYTLDDVGIKDTNDSRLYYMFNCSTVTDPYFSGYPNNSINNKLKYINYKDYIRLSKYERGMYWTINNVNCYFIRGIRHINEVNNINNIKSEYEVFFVKSIKECYKRGQLHHIEVVGV